MCSACTFFFSIDATHSKKMCLPYTSALSVTGQRGNYLSATAGVRDCGNQGRRSPLASNVLRAKVFSISEYIGLLTWSSIIPFLTLTNSMKFVSSTAVKVVFDNVNATLNLSAPAAFSFVVPVELSCKEVSSRCWYEFTSWLKRNSYRYRQYRKE